MQTPKIWLITGYSTGIGYILAETLLKNYSGNQKGDPKKAANAIMMIASHENPPLHLALGNDALERIRMKLKAVEKDLNEWEHVSKSMEFDN